MCASHPGYDSTQGSGGDCGAVVGKLTTSVSTAIAELFNACRSNQVGQDGGWWSPVPAPAEGEELDHRKNCNHAPFARVVNVRKHFYDQHWDFGVWSGVPRALRTSSLTMLKCQCGIQAYSLQELDDHVIVGITRCTPYCLHRVELIPVR